MIRYALALTGGILFGLGIGSMIREAFPADGFVHLLEMRFAMQPGQTRVLQECGCTVRYMGTSVNGRHYNVRIDRLD